MCVFKHPCLRWKWVFICKAGGQTYSLQSHHAVKAPSCMVPMPRPWDWAEFIQLILLKGSAYPTPRGLISTLLSFTKHVSLHVSLSNIALWKRKQLNARHFWTHIKTLIKHSIINLQPLCCPGMIISTVITLSKSWYNSESKPIIEKPASLLKCCKTCQSNMSFLQTYLKP